MQSQNALQGAMVAFCYSGILKDLVIGLKYRHQKEIGNFLGQRLAILLQTNPKLQGEKIIISWAPSHRYREHFVKGYNQAEIIAKSIAEQSNLPIQNLLDKTKHTQSQVRLNKDKRRVNTQNSMNITPGIELMGNETILLVDDIITTGSTLNEAALTLKSRRPKLKIRGLTVARHC